MCIAVPMRVLEVRNDCDVVVTRPGRTEIANASFADEMPEVGDLVLVFRGTILRTVSQDEALKIESALCCVEEAMRTDEAETPPLPTSLKTPESYRLTCKSSSDKRHSEANGPLRRQLRSTVQLRTLTVPFFCLSDV